MTTTTTVGPASEATSVSAPSTAVDSADRQRLACRREAVLAGAVVALIAAIVLFGLVFPELLAPAVGIAVLAVILALDWLLPTGELRRASKGFRRS